MAKTIKLYGKLEAATSDGVLADAGQVALNDGKTVQAAIESLNSKYSTLESGSLKRQVVSALPAAAQAKENIIYLVPASKSETNNVFNEYLWIASTSKFEFIGSTSVDLSGYATKAEVQENERVTAQALTDLEGKITTAGADANSKIEAVRGEIEAAKEAVREELSDDITQLNEGLEATALYAEETGNKVKNLEGRLIVMEARKLAKVVTKLPPMGADDQIYLVAVRNKSGNYYNEYLWIDGKYEFIGSTGASLDGYITEAEKNRLVASTTGFDVAIKGTPTTYPILLKPNDVLKFIDESGNIDVYDDINFVARFADGDEGEDKEFGLDSTVSMAGQGSGDFVEFTISCPALGSKTANTKLFIVNNAVTNVGISVLDDDDVTAIFNEA